MRRPSKTELALLVGTVIATGMVNAQQDEMPEVDIYGYQFYFSIFPLNFANEYVSTTPAANAKPGGGYSATPNSHVQCTANVMVENMAAGADSTPSNPSNASLAIPLRYANPINIVYSSTYAAGFSATKASNGFAIFPNYAIGINAAIYTTNVYLLKDYTITDLVNAWAPSAVNPNALSNTLSGLGISSSVADATSLSQLTGEQIIQVIAAFAWQEGFKVPTC